MIRKNVLQKKISNVFPLILGVFGGSLMLVMMQQSCLVNEIVILYCKLYMYGPYIAKNALDQARGKVILYCQEYRSATLLCV
jgi:hypothetical protein